MNKEVSLTLHEIRIIDYLKRFNGQDVLWESLAKFSKEPTTVKLTTIQKSISEIKRKFVKANMPLPFSVKFKRLNCDSVKELQSQPQILIQMKKTPAGNIIPTDNTKHVAQLDFSLDSLGFKRVKTRDGKFQLNDSEWDMFKYFYNNPGRLVTISELRDKVMYPNYGSKMPARWFDSIMRVINNMRRQVNGLDKRLLTVKTTETSYLFQ